MRSIPKTISNLVRSQFPDFYRENGDNFIAFVEAYYQWLETEGPLYNSRRFMELVDIDQTIDDFVIHFKKAYLDGIQFDTLTDKRLLVKRVIDLYRSKGTERAVQLLFRLVFAEDIELYYPSKDIFALSDGTWNVPTYLEVTRQDRNSSFVGKLITGVTSGATAFVDRIVRRVVKGRYVDVFYISGDTLDFQTGELLKVDDDLTDVPTVIGSLSDFLVVDGSVGFKVGDIVDVLSRYGTGGKGRVSQVQDVTGIVSFTLRDGGWGFTNTSVVLVSNAVVSISNTSSPGFQRFEEISFTCPANSDVVTANLMAVSSNSVVRMSGVTGRFSPGETIVLGDSVEATALLVSDSVNSTLSNVTVTNVVGDLSVGLRAVGQTSGAVGNVASYDTTAGILNVNGSLTTDYTEVLGLRSNTTATLTNIFTGTGATFRIGRLANTETVFLNTDSIDAYRGVALDASAYGFPGDPSANASSPLLPALTYESFELGTVQTLVGINPGHNYNVSPFVFIYEPFIAGLEKKDYIIQVANVSGHYVLGETVTQAPPVPDDWAQLSVADAEDFLFQEAVYQETAGSNTAVGTVQGITSGILLVETVSGSWQANDDVLGLVSSASGNVTSVATSGVFGFAQGSITAKANGVIHVRRLSISADFVAGANVVGSLSGVSANAISVAEDPDSLPAGLNAVVVANVFSGNGSVVSLDVAASGLGHANNELITFTSQDGLRSGTARTVLGRQGHAEGFYTSSKGFLSSDKYLADGEYYQDFSYEIKSSLDVDRYADMVKRVTHVAGTKMFGRVVKVSEVQGQGNVVSANVTQTGT